MEVEGLASSTTNPWNGSWAVSNATAEAEVASEMSGGVVLPNVRPVPLNATYFGSGGACFEIINIINTQGRHMHRSCQ